MYVDKIALALQEFQFRPFPNNLKKVMKERWLEKYTGNGIATYVRHYLTNYDKLYRKYKMNSADVTEFKAEVNERIYKALNLYNQFHIFMYDEEFMPHSPRGIMNVAQNREWWERNKDSYQFQGD